MKKIGIICPSEIASRRFLPALSKRPEFEFVGVAVPDKSDWIGLDDKTLTQEREKAQSIINSYGGELFDSYSSIVNSDKIDAIYLPLPPSLHFKWAQKALNSGKHVLVEKPATTSLDDTDALIQLASSKNLALHENYMFAFHEQLKAIGEIIHTGEIGDVRLYRISFGFPRRASNDFRYNKALGGGALLDAGGYTIKYASMLLGAKTKLVQAQLQFIEDFEVDIAGSGVLVNEEGQTAQIAFGMDNSYKCDLEVWGSQGSLKSGRVLTAPDGFTPEVSITVGTDTKVKSLPVDDAFMKSIGHFNECIEDRDARNANYENISKQAALVQQFMSQANF